MDKIIDGLWIGDIQDVREGETARFDRVISVCQDSVEDNVGCEYDHFNMADGPWNSYGGNSSYELFHNAAMTLLDALISGETVLCHCHRGQSRSASVSIAALGVYLEESYDMVYSIVEHERPQIHPDPLLDKHAKKFIEETDMKM